MAGTDTGRRQLNVVNNIVLLQAYLNRSFFSFVRLFVYEPMFSQRTIPDWNQLSHDCVNASSVNMFKNKIDNYLAMACYT